MFNLLLKLGAVVIALLMAALMFAQHFDVGLGIRKTDNIFTNQIGNMTIISWLLIVLALLEFITVVLILSPRSARST